MKAFKPSYTALIPTLRTYSAYSLNFPGINVGDDSGMNKQDIEKEMGSFRELLGRRGQGGFNCYSMGRINEYIEGVDYFILWKLEPKVFLFFSCFFG